MTVCAPVQPKHGCLHRLIFRLQEEEARRQELEDLEVDIRQEEVRRLIVDYMVGATRKNDALSLPT